jgi:glycine oxidase
MSEHPDVLILGGGVIGLTVAYSLARERVAVALLDQGDFGQEASWAGAGILPPGSPRHARTPVEQFRAASTARFARLSEELRELTGLDNGYRVCGGLEFVDPDAAAGEEWSGEGATVEMVSGRQLRELEPALAPGLEAAYHLPQMAQVRNPRHLKALVVACSRLGVRLLPGCPAYGFERQEGHITAARTAAGPLAAGQFLVATGAWTGGLLEPFGWRPGIRPVRGQIALLRTAAPLFRRVLMHGSRYLVPRPDGRLLVGSTEEDAGFDKHTTAEAIAGLLALATSLVPGLAAAHVERCWAGLRPGSPDGLPFLGRVPGTDNLFVAAGHFRAGIQLSPATGQVMYELLLGREPTLPLEPFRPDRPAAVPSRDSAHNSAIPLR